MKSLVAKSSSKQSAPLACTGSNHSLNRQFKQKRYCSHRSDKVKKSPGYHHWVTNEVEFLPLLLYFLKHRHSTHASILL
jgi:hypothetical protein